MVLSSSVLAKRFYRRTLFIVSIGLAFLSMLALGAFFYYLDSWSSQSFAKFKWIPLASLMVFFAAIGMGLGGLPWLISSEILPAKFRGPGKLNRRLFQFSDVIYRHEDIYRHAAFDDPRWCLLVLLQYLFCRHFVWLISFTRNQR